MRFNRTHAYPVHKYVEDVKESISFTGADQQLSEIKVKELETKVERLEIDLQRKSKEKSALETEVEGLKSKLGARSYNDLNQEDKNFDVQFQVPFENLRRHMNSSYKKNIGIAEVAFIAKVNLAKRELDYIQIIDADSLESAN